MTGKRITARRRERIDAMTDRQRSAFSPPNYLDLVTHSTLEAAVQDGRRLIGIEHSEEYAALAAQRIEAADRARDDALDEAAVDAIADGRANDDDGWHVGPFDELPF